MLGKVEALVAKCQKAADMVRHFSGEVRLVSHHDCDGICSAAIMTRALLREGKRFRLSFVKQLTSGVIDSLAAEDGRLTIFTDLGSGQLDAVQAKLLRNGAAAIILDHHQPQGEVFSDRLLHINTHAIGLGDHISGSGVSYIMARALNPANMDLSGLGVVGAIGDSQAGSIGHDWGLAGVNKEILKDAQACGAISVSRGLRLWGRTTRPLHKALEYCDEPAIPGVSGSESGAVHFLQELGIPLKNGDEWRTLSDLSEDEMKRLASGIIKERVAGNHENPDWIFGDVYCLSGRQDCGDAAEFATMVNAAGKQAAAHLGVELCLGSRSAFGEVQPVLECYRREIGRALGIMGEGNGKVARISTPTANYLLAGGSISEFVISNVTSILSKSRMQTPVFSLVDAEDNMTKVSARLPQSMTGKVNLKDVVEQAAKASGGEGGGHGNAAGASIPRGSEQAFINRVETILTNLSARGIDGDGGRNEGKTEGRAETGSQAAETARAGAAAGRPLEGQGLVRYICA